MTNYILPIAQSRPSSSRVGWTGDANGADLRPFVHDDVRYVPVKLCPRTKWRCSTKASPTPCSWPLYHDALRPPLYDHHWWHTYQEVNRRLRRAGVRAAAPGATVWVHDYQLHLVPGYVRDGVPISVSGSSSTSRFHPWSCSSSCRPTRSLAFRGTLGGRHGFQTPTHADNFARAVERLVGWEPTEHGLRAHGSESHFVAAFPISIDVAEAERMAQLPKSRREPTSCDQIIGPRRTLLLGVDRLDYTKGIDRRLMALYELLDQQRLSADEGGDGQVAVPSREDAPGYSELRDEVERLAGAINGRVLDDRRDGAPLPVPVGGLRGVGRRCTEPPTSCSSPRCATG
ncbi:MAG: trehalose-6-phosphate synthase [Ilumatobacteraceae bacterium]